VKGGGGGTSMAPGVFVGGVEGEGEGEGEAVDDFGIVWIAVSGDGGVFIKGVDEGSRG